MQFKKAYPFLLILAIVCVFLQGLKSVYSAGYDILIREGCIYDGSGNKPFKADLGINGDTITFLGSSTKEDKAKVEINAKGLAVSPGFINMLSWATESLIEDGSSQSDIRQGVTLEVFGEGWSMGPLTDYMKQELIDKQIDVQYEIQWTKLSEYLEFLVNRGVSTNVASFVGATNVRMYVLGHKELPPSPPELLQMQTLVKQAMEEGALGLASALIYEPATYANTEELIALAEVVAQYGGMYLSHVRSEGRRLLEAIDEVIRIGRETGIRAEIYHLKAAGRSNWDKLDKVIQKIQLARAAGIKITANIYTYTAAASGLDAAMPPWVQNGGIKSWVKRLKEPDIRKRVINEMLAPSEGWENLYFEAGSPENILLIEFKTNKLKPLTGKTLAEVSALRNQSPEETAIDLVIEDKSQIGAIYFLMSEENVVKKIALPWVSFGSDAGSLSTEGVFLKSNPHPRAYGNFARLLGKYVRDEKVLPLEEAIRRMTSFPAKNLQIDRRGFLKPSYYADIVIFDPNLIKDMATFVAPHQYSRGVTNVIVNGKFVLKDGKHTGAKPGRVIHGPGWVGWKKAALDS